MTVKTYDPKQVSVIVGTTALSGWADGEFVEAERDEDAFSLLVGADGEATRSKSANRSGTVTLRLLQGSAVNDTISALTAADELSGAATFPILIKDSLGTTLLSAVTAWVQKYPNVTFGKEVGEREWVLRTDELLIFVGGNTPNA